MGKNANGGEADILDKVKRVAQGGRGSVARFTNGKYRG